MDRLFSLIYSVLSVLILVSHRKKYNSFTENDVEVYSFTDSVEKTAVGNLLPYITYMLKIIHIL